MAVLAGTSQQAAYANLVMPYALKQQQRTGIPAEVFIIQSGVETGWGTSRWFRSYNNPAGIGVTGAPGAGYHFASLDEGFAAYADKLMGHGEAGQGQFVADVRAGAPTTTLLTDLQNSPWAAGHYGYHSLVDSYHSLYGGGSGTTGQNVPGYTPGAGGSGVQAAGLSLPDFGSLLNSPLAGPLGSFGQLFGSFGSLGLSDFWKATVGTLFTQLIYLGEIIGGFALVTLGVVIILVDSGAMQKAPAIVATAAAAA